MNNADIFPTPPAFLSANEQQVKSETTGEKFVVFFLSDELFAVRASAVAEVLTPPVVTPLPNAPFWLHGIASLRGAIIPVLNLARLCNKRSASASAPKSKLIVLKPQTNAAAVAFPVDRLSEMVTLSSQDIKSVDNRPFFGKAFYRSGSVSLIETEQLFSTIS